MFLARKRIALSREEGREAGRKEGRAEAEAEMAIIVRDLQERVRELESRNGGAGK